MKIRRPSLDETVEISGNCYYNILRHINEMHRIEPRGDIIGKKEGRKYILINAYPITTARGTPSGVTYGNKAAERRNVRMNKAQRELHEFFTIGQYHIHKYFPYEDRKDGTEFSKAKNEEDDGDIEAFTEWMEDLGLEESIQIVASVRIKKHRRRHQIGEYLSKYKRKFRIIVKYTPFETYDIIFAAYKLCDRKTKELNIYPVKITSVKRERLVY